MTTCVGKEMRKFEDLHLRTGYNIEFDAIDHFHFICLVFSEIDLAFAKNFIQPSNYVSVKGRETFPPLTIPRTIFFYVTVSRAVENET